MPENSLGTGAMIVNLIQVHCLRPAASPRNVGVRLSLTLMGGAGAAVTRASDYEWNIPCQGFRILLRCTQVTFLALMLAQFFWF